MLVKLRILSIIPMVTVSCLSTISFLGTFNLPEAIAQTSSDYIQGSKPPQLYDSRVSDDGEALCRRHFRNGCL